MLGLLKLISSNAVVTIIAAALLDMPVLSQAAAKFCRDFASLVGLLGLNVTSLSLSSLEYSFEDELDDD